MSEREARKQARRRARATGRSSSVYVPVSPHVRLYAWELDCPAYRTLSPDARALLVELRALYRPSTGNEVFLSVREARRRLANVGQAKVQAAFAALEERGWIEEVKAGSFDQKTGTGRARSFLLTNIGPNGDDVDAKKTYMRWKPYASECPKNTVLKVSTPRTQGEYGYA
ncbi:hypothetical protein [Stenotrophomonas maltophilia]|uniref:hypothetical protein n=1 Tax=Stenotrophomonas maltophilia TaxID=40324 RepID=UPI001953E845|nr:hypothetical protein [Stenotrophomonas maltophilia]